MASQQKYSPTRTIRVDNEVWEAAKARAQGEGLSISQVLQRFVTGYAEGKIDAPQVVMVYGRNESAS